MSSEEKITADEATKNLLMAQVQETAREITHEIFLSSLLFKDLEVQINSEMRKQYPSIDNDIMVIRVKDFKEITERFGVV